MGHWRPLRRGDISSAGQGPPVRFEVVNAGLIADAAQLLIEAVPESVSVQDARPSSRRRIAAANLRPGARSIGSYGRGEKCSCCRCSCAAVTVAAAGVKSHQFFYHASRDVER
jgi:hypothetical protein